jgi:hypothetical protein
VSLAKTSSASQVIDPSDPASHNRTS